MEDKNFTYYEKHAAFIWNIDPGHLFLKSRKRAIVFARWFCIWYRRVKLGMTESKSAGRYNQSHCTTHGIVKTFMPIELEYNRDFSSKFDFFIEKCNSDAKILSEKDSEYTLLKKIDEQSFNKYIRRIALSCMELSTKLVEFSLDGDRETEEEIWAIADKIDIDVTDIKFLFRS